LLENEEFALNAIKFHGITLRDFPKFIQDKLFVIEAVKASPDEIRYVPFEMLDQDLIRASDYSIEKLRSRFIPKKLLVEIFTPAFIEEYVQKKPDWSIVRIYMLFEAINSEEEFSACVEKMDRSVILNDIIKSPGRIVFYPHLKKNPKFIEEAIKINPDIKKYLQD